MVSAVVMVVAAVLLFRVEVIGRMLPASVVTLLLGAACFCALGMAVAAVIPNGERRWHRQLHLLLSHRLHLRPVLPLPPAPPAWVGTAGSILPVRHFAVAMEHTFNPLQAGSGFCGGTWACWPCGRSPGGSWPSASSAGATRRGAGQRPPLAGRPAEADPAG